MDWPVISGAEIIKDFIYEHGFDGLCGGCPQGCGIDDGYLENCESLGQCTAASVIDCSKCVEQDEDTCPYKEPGTDVYSDCGICPFLQVQSINSLLTFLFYYVKIVL